MYKKYILSSIRFLSRKLGYTAINIVGLSVGIAISVLLFIYVFDELTYDSFQENKNQIHLVARDGCRDGEHYNTGSTSPPTANALIQDFPEIENVTRVVNWYAEGRYMKYNNELVPNLKFIGVDSTFFDIFTVDFLHGNPKTALTEPNTIVITESTVKKFFETNNPIGEVIQTLAGSEFTITGVVKDYPENSHIQFDILFSTYTVKSFADPRGWFNHSLYTYIKLKQNANADELESKLPDFAKKQLGPIIQQAIGQSYDEFFSDGDYYSFFLEPLSDIHLGTLIDDNNEGKKSFVHILGLVGILVLFLACINYINLATAMASTRQLEIGVKKTFGVHKKQLTKQFIGEAILVSFISMSFGMLIIEGLLPYFNNIINKSYEIDYFINPYIIPGLILFSIVIGVLSGLYPGLVMSSYNAVSILGGKVGISSKNKKNWFRNILVITQFAICIGIMIFTITINQQIKYILNRDLGIDKEQILVLHMIGGLGEDRSIFKENLLRDPAIKNFSYVNSTPYRHFNEQGHHVLGRPDDQIPYFHTFWADYDIIETLDIEIIQGRALSEEYSEDRYGLIINEAAAKQIGEENPMDIKFDILPSPLEDTAIFSVKGVFKNFHFASLHNGIEGMAIYPVKGMEWYSDYAMIKLSSGNIPETVKEIKKQFNDLTSNYPFQYSFLDEDFNNLYQKEIRAKKLLFISTLVAIFIATLGLIGLASFIINKKTKEIGIRKAMGASPLDIAKSLIKQFSVWIIIANLISWPVAYYFVNKWLNNFAYHVEISWVVFALVAIITLLVAVLTISFHTYIASTKNPVDTLRYE
ncbi:MAG: ABC transporter permease [Bacteroidales bacterium]|nr:ABC transporter permease [Bacteroidales bacterium]